MTTGRPLQSTGSGKTGTTLQTLNTKCTNVQPVIAGLPPVTTGTHFSVGVGTSSSDINRTKATISHPVGDDIELLIFRNVSIQTGNEPEPTSANEAGPRIDRYPTSKLSKTLPDTVGSPSSIDDVPSGALVEKVISTRDVSVQGDISPDRDETGLVVAKLTGSTGLGDLRWLKWASDDRSPLLQTFVSSILSGSRKDKSDFLKVDASETLPRKFSSSWFVPVRLGNKDYHFLCDTGSAAMIIRPEVYKR